VLLSRRGYLSAALALQTGMEEAGAPNARADRRPDVGEARPAHARHGHPSTGTLVFDIRVEGIP
jgi:hypothetical protein